MQNTFFHTDSQMATPVTYQAWRDAYDTILEHGFSHTDVSDTVKKYYEDQSAVAGVYSNFFHTFEPEYAVICCADIPELAEKLVELQPDLPQSEAAKIVDHMLYSLFETLRIKQRDSNSLQGEFSFVNANLPAENEISLASVVSAFVADNPEQETKQSALLPWLYFVMAGCEEEDGEGKIYLTPITSMPEPTAFDRVQDSGQDPEPAGMI